MPGHEARLALDSSRTIRSPRLPPMYLDRHCCAFVPPLAKGGGGRILPKGGNNWCPATELMGKWLACGKLLRNFAGQTRLKIVWQYDNVKGAGAGVLDRLRYAAYARRVLRGSALLWYPGARFRGQS